MRCPFPLSPALSDLPPQFKLLLSLCDQGCRAMKTKAGRRLGKLLAPRGMLLNKIPRDALTAGYAYSAVYNIPRDAHS